MNEEDKIELRSEEFQEVLGYVPPWILRWGITVLAVVVVILLVGSAIIKYPDVIPAQIVLTGSTPPAIIATHFSGKIDELFVKDNQEVKVGDYLAIIDNPANTEDILKLKKYIDCFVISIQKNDTVNYMPDKNLQVGNLQSFYTSFYASLFDYLEYRRLQYYPQKIEITNERISQYEKQYQNLLTQQKIFNEQSELLKKQYRRDSILYTKKIISDEDVEKSRIQYLENRLTNENMLSSLRNMQIQISQLKESLLDTEVQDTEKLNTLQSQLRSYISQLKAEIQAWELNYVLISPVNGIITFTNYWTVNQNVNVGDEVFTIIPNHYEIIGKALLPVTRSGKVKKGQKVNIRLDNFPDNEYGILRAKVENISLVPSFTNQILNYTVGISLSDGLKTTYQKELPFHPNMQGQAEIITEDISLLERFILPIKKILKENL